METLNESRAEMPRTPTSPGGRSRRAGAGRVILILSAEPALQGRLTFHIEDVRSGQRVQFDSLEPLLDFIARMFRAADAVVATSRNKPPPGEPKP